MKHLLKLSILLLALFVPATALAHDFEVDGIYYNINGTTATVTVTFKGSNYYQYSDEYSGNVTIPTAVTYNGKTYSVTTIGSVAFYGCSGLTSVTIPNSVTTIETSAFSSCSGLTSISVANGNPNYDSRNNCNAIIETASNTLIVGCQNSTIPNSVTAIGSYAFFSCTGLTSVTIPNSVTTIGDLAFCDCFGLSSVTIPNSVTIIGELAFESCSNLTNMFIPNSVISIGSSAFSSCSGLTSISVANDNPNYDSRNNCNAIIETASNTLIAGCQNSTIPNSVTTIGNYAFYGCTSLTGISIPSSVTTIGNSAFCGCTGLTGITIPNSVTAIGDRAFQGCTSLSSVTISNSVTSIGSWAFYGSRLRNITCHAAIPPILSDDIFDPNTCTYGKLYVPRMSLNSYIASDYWKNFKSINGLYDFTVDGFYYRFTDDNTVALTYKDLNYNSYAGDITIPSSVNYGGLHTVTSIDDRAFYNCNDLTSITIPNTIGSIGVSAFKNCNNLSNVDIQDSSSWSWYHKSIGDSAFCNCSSLTSIIIPKYVSSIGTSAFSGCTGLTNVTMSHDNLYNYITTIGSSAFQGCTSLTSITLPNSVTTIGDRAFSGCTDLTSVTLPNALRYISSYAFSDCSSLKDLTIPDDVTDIGYYAFSNCRSLTSVIIPDSVTYILDYSFKNCSNLTCVTIGESVTEIDQNVFQGCTALETLNFNAINLRYVAPNTFSNIATINYGDKVKRIPANFANGMANMTDLNLPNTITSIGRNAFFGTTWYDNQPNGLVYAGSFAYIYKGIMPENTSIIIRDGTVGIADGAFEWMDEDRFGLINVTLPNSMTYIGEYAFCDCGGLTSVIIPNSVTYIGESAFEGCWSLTSVNIPNSMTSLNENVFSYCTSLTNVTIPNSIRNIDYGAFRECSKLNEVYCYIDDLSNISMSNKVFELYDGGYESRTLYVPSGTLNAYQADTKWSSFFGSIVEIKDIFEMPDTSLLYWETVTIPIVLNNDHPILAFQTDIVLPEGFSIVADEEDEYLVTPSSRLSDDHVMMASDYGSGVVRVVCYTPESYLIDGYTGDLFYITVKVPEEAAGEYPIILRNSRLTTEDYTELRIPDASAIINVKTYIPGDANNSRSVTVTDIVVTAQYVLGRNPQPFTFDAADMNGDGDVTVTDIMLIAYMLQHPSVDAPQRLPALTANHDRMSADAISLMPGETRTVSIMLDNDRSYSAFQLDLTLPEGLAASNFALTDRAGGHAFDVSAIDDGKLRALCYSPALATISGHEGALLTFDVTAMDQVTGDIIVDAIELVTDACQTVNMGAFAILVNNASTVNEVASGKSVARVDYYNVAGQQIAEPTSGVTIIVTTYTDGTRSTTKLQR